MTGEQIIRRALEARNIRFVFSGEHKGKEADERQKGLDFFLPDHGIYIEVKDFHSDRIAEQMARDPNVIAIQGRQACEVFALLIA